MKDNYSLLEEKMAKIADISYAISVLNWDQETYMPKKGAKHRAQQISTLSAIAHEQRTSEELGKLLEALSHDSSLNNLQKRNVELGLKDYKKAKKLPTEFVVRLSEATSKAFHAWIAARKANDFKVYIEPLEAMVKLQQEKAAIYGFEEHPYDALMDDYEPDAKVKEIDVLFKDVRDRLGPFIQKVFEQEKPDNQFMFQHFPHKKQWDFGMEVLKDLGYDLEAGRQDVSEHPFTTSFSPLDVRVTTRVDENNFYDMLWSCIHEGGHALYEQGIPEEQYGMPVGNAVSLGIHESQSRLYENNLGRSLPFWKANYSKLQGIFPEALGPVKLETFYKGINRVEPSLIRTDADELTYHFHIMIRYEIEKKLIEGSIAVSDLPEIWNQSYKDYLNVEVPDDKQGVLQDIHWAHGGFGYFPTYSLGSFYAAQFYKKAQADLSDLEGKIANGSNKELLKWLRVNIHKHGSFYKAKELCVNATGEPLDFKYFMEYAEEKYGEIYGIC